MALARHCCCDHTPPGVGHALTLELIVNNAGELCADSTSLSGPIESLARLVKQSVRLRRCTASTAYLWVEVQVTRGNNHIICWGNKFVTNSG